jgi:hypothetical protein
MCTSLCIHVAEFSGSVLTWPRLKTSAPEDEIECSRSADVFVHIVLKTAVGQPFLARVLVHARPLTQSMVAGGNSCLQSDGQASF